MRDFAEACKELLLSSSQFVICFVIRGVISMAQEFKLAARFVEGSVTLGDPPDFVDGLSPFLVLASI
ncbi:hypothetical protein ACS0TY_013277 [Phlomoides rotata]